MTVPKTIIDNLLQIDGTKYISVKMLRSSIDKNEMDKFSNWFFGKPVVIGVDKECGISLEDLELFYSGVEQQAARRAHNPKAVGSNPTSATLKLDICTHTRYKKDFLTVDGTSGPNVDIVADIRGRLPFEDNNIEEIFSCATVEHLTLIQAQRLFKEFYRILQRGGQLTVAVPDFNRICRAYIEGTLTTSLFNQYLYGQLSDSSFIEFDCHKSIYDYNSLLDMLRTAGFIDIHEVEYDIPMHIKGLMIKVICKKPLK